MYRNFHRRAPCIKLLKDHLIDRIIEIFYPVDGKWFQINSQFRTDHSSSSSKRSCPESDREIQRTIHPHLQYHTSNSKWVLQSGYDVDEMDTNRDSSRSTFPLSRSLHRTWAVLPCPHGTSRGAAIDLYIVTMQNMYVIYVRLYICKYVCFRCGCKKYLLGEYHWRSAFRK